MTLSESFRQAAEKVLKLDGRVAELEEAIEALRLAVGEHYLQHPGNRLWTHIILNDDGELMPVEGLMDGDVVVFER